MACAAEDLGVPKMEKSKTHLEALRVQICVRRSTGYAGAFRRYESRHYTQDVFNEM